MATFQSQVLRRVNRLWYISRGLSKSSRLSAEYASPLPDAFYNEDQKRIQETVGKIIETDINPNIDEWEAKGEFPSHQIIKKFGQAGLLGIRFPEEYGGQGLGYKDHAAFLEQMGTIRCGGVTAGITAHSEITLPALERFGSDELKKQFLEPSIKGDMVACLGVSEPHAGSDVANIKTFAVRDGDDYIINGSKMWTTNGMKADWINLLVNTSKAHRHKNKSLVCVPMNLKGVTKTKIHKLGWHSSDTAQVFFEDVRVPVKNVIGDEGAGFFYQMLQFQEERLGGTLAGLKSMDTAISDTIEYTRQRQAFGKSILDNQYVHFRLAELATEVEALRALVYQAVDMMVAGEDVTRLASMTKLKSGRLSRIVADSCLQFWGGMGYTKEAFISRMYRDCRIWSIGAGADEVQLEILAKMMNISPKKSSSR